MWNFDGSCYQAEAQRRAELYAQADRLRAAQGDQAEPGLIARIGRLLSRLDAQLQGAAPALDHAAERR